MRGAPRLKRYAVLAALLATVGVVVPDSGQAVTQATLVEFEHAEGVALEEDMVWVLAVGSDARLGQDMTRTRGDALQLIGMNTRTGAATAIGVPRDSYVPIPGHGSDRVNAALFYGGPQLLGETVGNLVGVEPDYVFVTRFEYFAKLVDGIGGITVRNPRAFSDPYLRPAGFPAGRLELGGQGATAFGRVRKSLPGGDFDRSANQQRVLRGIQAKVADRADRPGFVEQGVFSVLKYTATDLGPAALFRLAHAVAQVDPRRITGCVVTGGFATVGGASVVTPNVALARRYGADARKDAAIENC